MSDHATIQIKTQIFLGHCRKTDAETESEIYG